MTDKQTPSDWVLIEAAKRFGWNDVSEYLSAYYQTNDPPGYRALCDMIERYEQPPVDLISQCARTAVTSGDAHWTPEQMAVCAIELWESGYGS